MLELATSPGVSWGWILIPDIADCVAKGREEHGRPEEIPRDDAWTSGARTHSFE